MRWMQVSVSESAHVWLTPSRAPGPARPSRYLSDSRRRRASGLTPRVPLRPGDDVRRARDHVTIVEDEHRHEALAGQPLDLPARGCEVRQAPQPIRPHDLRRIAGLLQGVVGPLARVKRWTPGRVLPRPWDREGPAAHVELHARVVLARALSRDRPSAAAGPRAGRPESRDRSRVLDPI